MSGIRHKAVVGLLFLSSCVGLRPTQTQDLQTINQGAAVLAGGELLVLGLMGKWVAARGCLQDAIGATAQYELALAPQGLPKQSLWVWDWPSMVACETAALSP